MSNWIKGKASDVKAWLKKEFEGGPVNHEELKEAGPVEGWKPTNPKDLVGVRKVPMSTLSGPVLMEVGLGMMEGACKYGRHNYRVSGVAASVYYDATMRHLMLWWEGEDIDPDSGLSHVTKAISSLFVLRDAMINQQFRDDRPVSVVNQEWLRELNKKAAAIADKYPHPKQPHTELPLTE